MDYKNFFNAGVTLLLLGSAIGLCQTEDNPLLPNPRAYSFDDLIFQGSYADFDFRYIDLTREAILRTQGQVSKSLGANASKARLHVIHNTLDPEPTNLYTVRLGAESFVRGFRYLADAGINTGTEIPAYSFYGLTSGPIFGLDYGVLILSITEPKTESRELFNKSVSEHKFTTYLEKSFFDWVFLTGDLNLRATNIKDRTALGRGHEGTGKIFLGRPNWLLRAGPWVYNVNWTTANGDLENIFPERSTFVGGILNLALSGKRRRSVKSYINLARGYQFADVENKSHLEYIETYLEAYITKSIALKFNLSFYASELVNYSQGQVRVGQIAIRGGF